MQRTKIEWTDYSVNPIKFRLHKTGKLVNMCTKVSPGCTNCYAEAITRRFWPKDEVEFRGYANQMLKHGEFVVMDHELEKVLKLNESLQAGRRDPEENKVFWGDMFDLFHEEIPFEMLDRIFCAMALTPNLFHQVLTKRTKRMKEFLNSRSNDVLSYAWTVTDDDGCFKPLHNVIGMTSVEDQETADERIPYLLECKLAYRGLSCEPLLGPVEIIPFLGHNAYQCKCGWHETEQLLYLAGYNSKTQSPRSAVCKKCGHETRIYRAIDQVIVGGESGPNARPMHPDWARSLRDQCQEAGVGFFFKQWGAWIPRCQMEKAGFSISDLDNNHEEILYNTGEVLKEDGSNWTDKKNSKIVAKVGKKAAGRLLDGREWNQMPEVKQ